MDVQTIPELLRFAMETRRKENAFLIKRPAGWEPISLATVLARVDAIQIALRERGVKPGDRIAILAESSLDWALSDMAILSMGAVTVPVYPTLPSGQVAPLLVDSGSVGAFCSTEEQRRKLESIRGLVRELGWVWCFAATALPEADGGLAPAANTKPSPDDLATIIYTSGTTGVPKGVMLTHANMVAQARLSTAAMTLHNSDLYLSFLPLSHVFERCSGLYSMLYAGATIAYAESIDRMPANMLELHPTILLGIPRFYEKVVTRASEAARKAGFPNAQIFPWARAVAIRWAEKRQAGRTASFWLDLQHAIASRLVYSKIARRLGGCLRLRVSGGAALNPDVAMFFYGAGQPICEGYGLSETASAVSVNPFVGQRVGTVGPVFQGLEVKIAPDGEILVRGPVVMKGYWNRPAETEAALEGGWLHTGDVGAIDPDGFLRITDRKKDLLVTSVGKKVAPQAIEEALKRSPLVEEAMIVGEGKKYIAALIAPAQGATREEIAAEVERVNSTLAQFEQIKKFELIPNDLSVENGTLTPSLKLKRKAVTERHRDLIERLFAGA
jgi:long-chain acyl-CoA synthetase